MMKFSNGLCAGLLVLLGCDMLKGHLPAVSAPSVPAVPGSDSNAPSVEASEADGLEFQEFVTRLQAYENAIKAFEGGNPDDSKDIEHGFHNERELLTDAFYASNPRLFSDVRKHPKAPALKARLLSLEARLAAYAGPEAKAVWGTGARTNTITPEGATAFSAYERCTRFLSPGTMHNATVEEQRVECTKSLERLNRIDPNALHFRGEFEGHYSDNLMAAVKIYVEMQREKNRGADNYPGDVPNYKTYVGCGFDDYAFQALQIGPSSYGPWQRRSSGMGTEEEDCKKMPKAHNVPADILAAAIKQFSGNTNANLNIYTMNGQISFVREDLPSTDLYKVARIHIHNPKREMKSNACGDVTDVIQCELSDDRAARGLNIISFYLGRAAAYKATKTVDKCKQLAMRAHEEGQALDKWFAEVTKEKRWDTSNTYVLRGGEKLSDAAIRARIPVAVKEADDKSIPAWCTGP
jgi:hypothetical protein